MVHMYEQEYGSWAELRVIFERCAEKVPTLTKESVNETGSNRLKVSFQSPATNEGIGFSVPNANDYWDFRIYEYHSDSTNSDYGYYDSYEALRGYGMVRVFYSSKLFGFQILTAPPDIRMVSGFCMGYFGNLEEKGDIWYTRLLNFPSFNDIASLTFDRVPIIATRETLYSKSTYELPSMQYLFPTNHIVLCPLRLPNHNNDIIEDMYMTVCTTNDSPPHTLINEEGETYYRVILDDKFLLYRANTYNWFYTGNPWFSYGGNAFYPDRSCLFYVKATKEKEEEEEEQNG